jgi:O-antigen ligase
MLLNFPRQRISSLLIELLLALLILFSPLVYGSITILPLSIVESLCFVILLVVIFKLFIESKISLFKVNLWPLILLVFFITLQIINLPESIFKLISPATVSLYEGFGLGGRTDAFPLSIYPEMSVHMLLQLVACIAVFLAVLNYVDSQDKLKRVITVIIIAGFLYSLYGIISKAYAPKMVFSTFTNRNHFSAYLHMIIPLTIALAIIANSRAKRIMLMFTAAVMIVASFYSWSRAGRISFVLSLILFFILLRVKRAFSKKILVVFILCVFVAIFVGIIGSSQLLNRMETLRNPIKAYYDRFEIIRDSFNIFKDFPVFGTGFNTFGEIAQKYKVATWQASYVFSHNEPVQLLVEVGIIGFLLAGIFLINSFIRLFTAWLKRKNDFSVFITIACLIGMFSVLFHSFFDFVFHVPANSILFFIILALAFRAAHLSSNENSQKLAHAEFNLSKSARLFILGIFIVAVIFMESLIVKRCQAQLIFEGLEDREMKGSGVDLILMYRKAIRDVDRAMFLNAMNSSYPNKKADLLADLVSKEDLGIELKALDDFGNRQEILSSAGLFYRRAISLNPTKADYHLRLGWFYNVTGEFNLAREEFHKALLLDPQNVEIKRYVDRLAR